MRLKSMETFEFAYIRSDRASIHRHCYADITFLSHSWSEHNTWFSLMLIFIRITQENESMQSFFTSKYYADYDN